MKIRRLLTLLLYSVPATSLHGALIIHEGFSGYSAGTVEGQFSSGTGLSGGGAWDEQGTVLDSNAGFDYNSSGLTYSQGSNVLSSSGGSLSVFRTGGTQVNKSISIGPAAFPTSLGAEVWISLLVNYDGTPATGSAMMGITIASTSATTNAATRPFGIGVVGGNLGAYGGSTVGAIQTNDVNMFDTAQALNTGVNLLVARINDGSPDTMRAWLNPTLGGGAPLDAAGFPITLNGQGWVNNATWGVNTVFAYNEFAAGSDTLFDEFRYGNTFADVTPYAVVPEPSTFPMLLGAASLLVFRRQNQRRRRG